MENKICVYAICKNEMKFVDKWLDSMSEADYIVVLDTGSTDGTFEKLQSDSRVFRTEQKVITPWRFDVARNESMKLVPDEANILVCTDLDEVFNKGWADVVRSSWKEDTNIMEYPYVWSHSSSGDPETILTYNKIHDRNFIWAYPIHEVIYPIDDSATFNAIKTKEITLEHFPDLTKSRASYFTLIENALEEYPNDIRIRGLYGREFAGMGDWEKAVVEYSKILDLPNINDNIHIKDKLDTYISLAEAYLQGKDYGNAIKYATIMLEEDKSYTEPYLILMRIFIHHKNFNMAVGCAEDAKKYAYQHFDGIEERDTYTGYFDNTASVAYFYSGDVTAAIKHVERALSFNPDNETFKANLEKYRKKYDEMFKK